MRHDPDAPCIHRHLTPDPLCRLLVVPIASQVGDRLHCHDLYELVVVRHGHGVHRLGERDWGIAAGEVFVIPPGTAHRYIERHRLSLINVLFAPLETWLTLHDLGAEPGWAALFEQDDPQRPGGRLRLRPEELSEVVGRCDRLIGELTRRQTGWRSLAAGDMQALVALLVRLWPLRGDSGIDPRLAELRSWLETHHHRPIGVREMAHHLGLAPRTLQRLCRAQLGCTPLGLVERIRLDHAARLLIDPRRSIAAVAQAVGFDDPSYFARRWRARFGTAPAAGR